MLRSMLTVTLILVTAANLFYFMASRNAHRRNARHRATVKFWDNERGYGFVAPDNVEARIFVHHSQIYAFNDRPRVLKAALMVRIKPGSYKEGQQTVYEESGQVIDPFFDNHCLEWYTKDIGHVVSEF